MQYHSFFYDKQPTTSMFTLPVNCMSASLLSFRSQQVTKAPHHCDSYTRKPILRVLPLDSCTSSAPCISLLCSFALNTASPGGEGDNELSYS